MIRLLLMLALLVLQSGAAEVQDWGTSYDEIRLILERSETDRLIEFGDDFLTYTKDRDNHLYQAVFKNDRLVRYQATLTMHGPEGFNEVVEVNLPEMGEPHEVVVDIPDEHPSLSAALEADEALIYAKWRMDTEYRLVVLRPFAVQTVQLTPSHFEEYITAIDYR